MQKKLRENIKKNMFGFIHQYMMFRFGQLDLNSWFDKALPAIDECLSLDPAQPLYGLMKSHAFLLLSKKEEANKILDLIEKNSQELLEYSSFQYAYYLYLQCINNKKDKSYHIKASKVFTQMATPYKDWRIEWFRLQIDDKYRKDPQESYQLIKRAFNNGCKSPVMYFEACKLLNEQPDLLFKQIGSFELQIFYWGSKNGFINKTLMYQLAVAVMSYDEYNHLLAETLFALYHHYKDKSVLKSICRLLIMGNRRDREAFTWYKLGVEEQLNLPYLNEYYLISCDKANFITFPMPLIRHFIFNAKFSDEDKAFLYANFLKCRDQNEKLADNYLRQMVIFAQEQLRQKNINKWLAYIYEQLFLVKMIPKAFMEQLVELFFSYEIQCQHKKMKAVVISHQEKNEEKIFSLKSGQAIIPIYTEHYQICFIDGAGKRYYQGVPYNIQKLFSEVDEFKQLYLEGFRNQYISIHLAYKAIKYQEVDGFTLQLFKDITSLEGISEVFKTSIMTALIKHYYDANQLDDLSYALSMVDFNYLTDKARNELIEYMIILGLNDEALKAIEMFGYEEIGVKKLYRLCSQVIEIGLESSLVEELCFYIFKNKKFDEKILSFLIKNYTGSLSEMYELWEEGKALGLSSSHLEEKILQQVLYTEVLSTKSIDVFNVYCDSHGGAPIIKAFLGFVAYQYVKFNYDLSDRVFDKIWELRGDEMNTIFEYALLKWLSLKWDLTKEEKEWVQEHILLCLETRRVLPWFDRFEDKVELPIEIKEKAYITYTTKSDVKVFINYRLEHEVDYQQKMMKQIGYGLFVEEFLLFYNEKLQYYIEEESSDGVREITQSNVWVQDKAFVSDRVKTPFDTINTMLMSRLMNDEQTLDKTIQEYMNANRFVQKVFQVIE